MSSFNKVIIMGNMTRDPELRVTPSGANICKFCIATSRKYKGGDGNMKEETAFIDVDAFGRQAEVIAQYFSKGKPIFVEGRLKFDQWESSAGEKRNKLSVVMEGFQFVSGARDSEFGSGEANAFESASPAPAPAGGNDMGIDDNVPF